MRSIIRLDELSTHDLRAAIESSQTTVVLLPIGSTEPHGPHLPLKTDIILSDANAERAAQKFPADFSVFVAPSLPYGVTDFAAGFAGAIGLSQATFSKVLVELVSQFLEDGLDHVSVINHHLDPNHLTAIEDSLSVLWEQYGKHRVSHPSVLEPRWGRHLGMEFRSGACHAGAYEGSMVLATVPTLFQMEEAKKLPKLTLSLSDGIRKGVETFQELGMADAYTGDPAASNAEFGHALLDIMCEMVITTVCEHVRSTS